MHAVSLKLPFLSFIMRAAEKFTLTVLIPYLLRAATGDRLAHAPHLGEHAREILGEMGYGAADIEKLTASGAVACYGG